MLLVLALQDLGSEGVRRQTEIRRARLYERSVTDFEGRLGNLGAQADDEGFVTS